MSKQWQPIRVKTFLSREDGSSFYEYVLVASLTVVVGIIVVLALGKGM
jgi:hypothetical protein